MNRNPCEACAPSPAGNQPIKLVELDAHGLAAVQLHGQAAFGPARIIAKNELSGDHLQFGLSGLSLGVLLVRV